MPAGSADWAGRGRDASDEPVGSQGPAFATPSVYCPFLPTISPHAASVQRLAVHWATRHGFLPDARTRAAFASAKFALLMARTYPEASEADLALATAWLTVTFRLDDTLETVLGHEPERLRKVASAIVAYLRGEPVDLTYAKLGPIGGALGDVWRRTRALTGPAWRERFIAHVAEYLDGNVWEATNRLTGHRPDPEEYRRMRRHSAATGMFFDLIEPLRHVELPAEVFADPDFIELRSHADNAVAWFNDLVSWPKEQAAGDRHNLVLVLREARKLSTVDALYTAVAEHDAAVHAFLEARERVLTGPHRDVDGLAGVVADLGHWIRGNIDWSQESGRYGGES
jgi:5-epi-alpha-selinene synthase